MIISGSEPAAVHEERAHSGISSATADDHKSWGKGAGLLTIATIAVSAGNYAFSLVATRLLSPAEFATFAAVQGLLLVLGTGCMAAVPWAMARYMTVQRHLGASNEAMHFGLVASVWQAAIVGPVAGVVMWANSGPLIGMITAVAGTLIALTAASTGYLQGVGRVAAIGWFRVIEVVGRVLASLALMLTIARTSSSALLGFPIGSALLLAIGTYASRGGFPSKRPERAVVRDLMRQSVNLGLIQVTLAMLAAIDGVVAQASRFDPITSASYQAAALLGRIPLFISGAIGLASYTALAGARNSAETGDHLRRAVLAYCAVALPIVVACCTVPQVILGQVIPHEYASAAQLLQFSAVSGALIGLINVVTTAHQARGRFRSVLRILVPAAVVQPILLLVAGRGFGPTAFAWTLVAASALTALAVCWDARRWHLFRLPEGSFGWLVILVALGATFLINHPVVWMLYITGVSMLSLAKAATVFRKSPIPEPAASPEQAAPAAKRVPRRIVTGKNPDGPKVVVIGDSYISGLGYTDGPAFGRQIADRLEFSKLLNLAASSRTAAETVEQYGDQIRQFQPDIAIVAVGATEGLVHPSAGIQKLIERFAPRSWHGVEGMMARANYSAERGERFRQQVQSNLKVGIKWALVHSTGARPRIPLDQAIEAADQLLALLDSVGTRTWMVQMPHAPKVRFPGTQRSWDRTASAQQKLAAKYPTVTYLAIAGRLHYFDDFLVDHLHLGGVGHAHVADLVLEEIRQDRAVPASRATETGDATVPEQRRVT